MPPTTPPADPARTAIVAVVAAVPGRATHTVSLTAEADVDDEVRALLRLAYEQNG